MPIHQEIALDAAPARVCELLTGGQRFAAATGKPAAIGTGEGAPRSMLDSLISKSDIERVPRQHVVQEWRALGWGPGAFSPVRLTLTEEGADVTVDHEAYPGGKPLLHPSRHEHPSAGWTFCFEPVCAAFRRAESADLGLGGWRE